MLAINDGTFVPSEGTLPAATVLARHHDGPVPDPPLHPMPFHANFDSPLYEDVRRCTSGQFRARTAATFADRIRRLANDRLDALLPLGSFDLTQDYGGIVAASMVCELVGLPVELAPDVLATVNAGSLAEPGSGVEVANARPGYLEYLTPPIIERRRAGGRAAARDRGQLDRLPAAMGRGAHRYGGGGADARRVHRGHRDGAQDRRARSVGTAKHPGQLAAVRADLDANVPVAREEMIRYCAPAQWFARTLRKPFTLHGTTINPGQRIITLLGSAARDDREYVNPGDFHWDRRSARILSFGRGTHFCLGVHLARLEITILVTEWLKRVPEFSVREEAASRPPSSFQWGVEHRSRRRRRGGVMWGGYRLVAPYTFARIDLAEPAGLADGQVLLRFLAAGICGSDLRLPGGHRADCPATRAVVRRRWTAFRSTRSPARSWPARTRITRSGDRVVGWASGFDGLMAQVIADGDGLTCYAPSLTPQHAIGLQPLACVLYAVEQLGDLTGKRVAVIGQGSIGLLFSYVAKRSAPRTSRVWTPSTGRRWPGPSVSTPPCGPPVTVGCATSIPPPGPISSSKPWDTRWRRSATP